ncbi:unnamed protein product, partial [Ectocarpus sp. 13 AM-2016]
MTLRTTPLRRYENHNTLSASFRCYCCTSRSNPSKIVGSVWAGARARQGGDVCSCKRPRPREGNISDLFSPRGVHPCPAYKPVSTFQAHAPSLFFHLAIASCRFLRYQR